MTTERPAVSGDDLERVARYTRSRSFPGDLRCTAALWGAPGVTGGAGLFLFATYATLPALTAVGADDRGAALMVRSAAQLDREHRVLARLTGLGGDDPWDGGIANPAVWSMLVELGSRHRGLRGMRQEYLDVFGGLVALACLRVRAGNGSAPGGAQVRGYWTYMRHALLLLGARPGTPDVAAARCARFVSAHTGTGARTVPYLTELFARHPRHVPACRRALFPATDALVARVLT